MKVSLPIQYTKFPAIRYNYLIVAYQVNSLKLWSNFNWKVSGILALLGKKCENNDEIVNGMEEVVPI